MKRRYLIWAVAAAIVVLWVHLWGVYAFSQAFTAPGGQYRVQGGHAVLNPGWQSPQSQCGPNGCQVPQQPQWQAPRRPMGPIQQAPQSAAQQPLAAVCRVHSNQGGPGYAGTGSLIDKDDTRGLVVTNEHVVRNSGNLSCSFPDGKTYSAKLVHSDPSCDVAILLIASPPAEPLVVATAAPQRGEFVTAHGYGSGRYAVSSGFVLSYGHAGPPQRSQRGMVREQGLGGQPNSFSWSGKARPGDSGSPILNRKGELVGIVWGGHTGESDGTPCVLVDRVATTAGRYLLPWNAKINDPARDPRLQPPAPLPPQQPPQVIVQPPQQGPSPQDLGPIQAAITDLDRRQSDLEARQDKVRDTAEALAKKYEKELPGISADVKAAIDGAKAADEKAADAKKKLEEATDEDNPKGIFGRIKGRIDERLGGVFETLPWLKYGLIGLAVGLGYLFLRKEGAKAAAGEPTAWQRVAALTPTDIDDKIAAKVAAGQAALHERLAGLHGSVATLAQTVAGKMNPPGPPTPGV